MSTRSRLLAAASALVVVSNTAVAESPNLGHMVSPEEITRRYNDGTWYVGAPTTFRLGTFEKITFTELSIGRNNFTFGRADLYVVLERKCGAHSSATAN
jgi:hypothetical protein